MKIPVINYVAAFGPLKSIGVSVWAHSAMPTKNAAEIKPLESTLGHGASDLPTLR